MLGHAWVMPGHDGSCLVLASDLEKTGTFHRFWLLGLVGAVPRHAEAILLTSCENCSYRQSRLRGHAVAVLDHSGAMPEPTATVLDHAGAMLLSCSKRVAVVSFVSLVLLWLCLGMPGPCVSN